MEHRPAEYSDLDRIMEIVGEAQRFLRESGVDQWQDGYPPRSVFEQDVSERVCHVFTIDGITAGVISVFFGHEASYDYVENGKWMTGDAPYALFHRAAVGTEYRGRGIASRMLSYAERSAYECGYKSIRGDTHRDNRAMRGLLEKRGFVNCGIIYLNCDRSARNERVCYEKLL